jgi:hypothetical protein
MPTWNPPAGPPPVSNEHYSVAGNWTGGVPTSATDAVFDGLVSNRNCIINNITSNCLRFRVINGYSGTITFTNNLNVYGNYEVDILSATSWIFTAAADRGLVFRANAIIDIPVTRLDSNIGMSIITSGVSITLTLARDTTISNFLPTVNGPNTTVSFIINRTSAGNGDNLFVTRNFAHGVFTGTGFFGGTTTINFTSSTTSVIAIGSAGVRNNMVINGTGTFTGTIGLGTGNTTTYTNGNTTGLSVSLLGASTIVSNGTTWNNVTFGSNTDRTLTITTDLISGGVISAATSYGWTITHTGGSVIRARGSGANNLNLANADVIVDTAIPCTVSLSNQNTSIDVTFNPFPGGQITWQGGNFIGTSTFTYLTSNGGPTPIATAGFGLTNTSSALTINTSPSPTNYIIFPSYTGGFVGGLVITLLSDLHINGPATINSAGHVFNGAGFSVICGGNTSLAHTTFGTASIQISYTGTWNSPLVIGNDLVISPFAGQTITIQTIAKGVTNKSITYTAGPGTLVSNASTLSIAGSITVPMTTFGMVWGNITVGGSSTITLNSLLSLSGSLICSGNATFTGAYGWTTQNFTCTVAASIITLQNIFTNPLAEYIVNGVLTLIGTLASKITLQAAGSATFNGTITPVGQLNYLSGTAPSVGMTVSQATGVSPVGLIGLLPNRPVITGGTSPTFTISPSATTVIGSSFSMRAGYKAKFTLTNGTGSQNVAYVTTQDIDSNAGATITSFGSNGDDINNSTISLFRTLNWGPLIAPSGSVYYTFVN